MKEAVIVSTARTAIGRAFKGSLNNVKSPSLLGHVMSNALVRANVDGAEIEDIVIGTVLGAGTAGMNVARNAAFAAGFPFSAAGQTIDRQCASGLMAIATAAKQVVVDGMQVVVAGGQENVSAVQHRFLEWTSAQADPAVRKRAAHAYMSMVETAEHVARKYGITRERQDEYALLSQQRTSRAQDMQLFREEIVPFAANMNVVDKVTGETYQKEVLIADDEGNRPSTTMASLAALDPVIAGGSVTAGNASQLSDGASACVIVERSFAERRNLEPLGVYRGMAVAGCAPEEMGIAPIYAIPKLLKQHGLSVEDIGLWELNEAFACQALFCRDYLGIDPALYNVNGGAISIGHPYGMTGSRMVGHALLEARRRKVRYVVAAMCVGGGMGAAALFERT